MSIRGSLFFHRSKTISKSLCRHAFRSFGLDFGKNEGLVATTDEELTVLVEKFTGSKRMIANGCGRKNFEALGFTFYSEFGERSGPWVVSADGAF